MNGRLYRSRRERMLAGVAGGLAEQWNMDPSLVRLVWALLVPLSGGLALVAYIVMAIIVPEAGSAAADDAEMDAAPLATPGDRGASGSAPLVIGGIIVIIGAWFLLGAYLPAVDLGRLWPVALIGIGLVILVSGMRARPPTPPSGPG
ncbi:MAG: PspC domain-containing protein [Candidatus Limnocylindria bacterium]